MASASRKASIWQRNRAASWAASFPRRRCRADGANHPRIRPAPADVPVHADDDFGVAGIWIAPQQRHRAQDHPRNAVAALHGVGIEESLLHGMQLALRREALDGDDALALHRAHLGEARFRGHAVHQHGARRALSLAAAEFRTGKIQIVPQDAEKCAVRIHIDLPPPAVHKQLRDPRHTPYYGAGWLGGNAPALWGSLVSCGRLAIGLPPRVAGGGGNQPPRPTPG